MLNRLPIFLVFNNVQIIYNLLNNKIAKIIHPSLRDIGRLYSYSYSVARYQCKVEENQIICPYSRWVDVVSSYSMTQPP